MLCFVGLLLKHVNNYAKEDHGTLGVLAATMLELVGPAHAYEPE